MFFNTRVFMDYASATPELEESIKAVAAASRLGGNPGALHQEALAAKKSLEESREAIAKEMGCKPRQIIFTSGGTEANSLAIVGRAYRLMSEKKLVGSHWITSSIEHSAVLESMAQVEMLGGTVTYVDPDARGIIAPQVIAKALRPETVFVSMGWGNHEIGIVQPLKEIARVIRVHEAKNNSVVLLHTDAGQSALYKHPHVHTLDVDLYVLNSAKHYGPRSIAALYVSDRAELMPVMRGGGQERGLRSGTEPVALAAGFAVAMKWVANNRASEYKRLEKIRDALANELQNTFPDIVINGSLPHGMPHIVNISIPGISSEYIVLALDRAGIAVTTKSACAEGEQRRSNVVSALGGQPWRAENTIRFSLGKDSKASDVVKVIKALRPAVALSRGHVS